MNVWNQGKLNGVPNASTEIIPKLGADNGIHCLVSGIEGVPRGLDHEWRYGIEDGKGCGNNSSLRANILMMC
jgi:hypothetical protein